MCQIKINLEERALVHSKTAQILRPSCFDDLILLHSYYLSANEQENADELLKKVFKGEKVITNMVKKIQQEIQQHHLK
jgi:hypothetical protein